MDRFPTPAYTQRFELIIKRSRFVSSVAHVAGRQDALAFVEECRVNWPDASHHCWAMVAGAPDDIFQQDQSDDGEPKGTAGKPILHVLQHSGLGNVVVVVTRYFGGVKLGAGGLVRAYSQASTKAIAELETRECVVRQALTISLSYTLLDTLEHWLRGTEVLVVDRRFGETVELSLMVPSDDFKLIEQKLDEIGAGSIRMRV